MALPDEDDAPLPGGKTPAGSVPQWRHCQLQNNSATAGGAAYVTANAAGAAGLLLNNCTLTENVSKQQVGGITVSC
jgi:hypothetical protein